MKANLDQLIEKYNQPAPRYTSYPTLPFWELAKMPASDWSASVEQTFSETNSDQGISLYIHLPYCESLCTYCACNTRITKNHQVEEAYISALLDEWKLYNNLFGKKPVIREIHLGGGTPTFFAPENLKRLINGITENAILHEKYSFSFEGHPNNTTKAHLQTLYEVGFRRVSYGVQDLDILVQQTINRIQPYENVLKATHLAREIGYESINFDLIYGLPFQTEATVLDTVEKVVALMPERIAFYSYAHVPWKRPGQRGYSETDLPDKSFKRRLYEVGKEVLLDRGYIDVGMDHFALPGDALYHAYQNKMMHRNFMGYTDSNTDLLIGLGASAISDANYACVQNHKNVEAYKTAIAAGQLPLSVGHNLTDNDQVIKNYIMDILCKGEVCWSTHPGLLDINAMIDLHTMADEGIIRLFETGFRVTDFGMPFLRNICMLFDRYLMGNANDGKERFSKAI